MQIKKILGILLALCFFMSVTVAAVSAEPQGNHPQGKHPETFKPGFNSKPVKHHPETFKPGFNHEGKKRYHHPASWKYVQICHKEYGHNHKVCKMIKVHKPAYDEWR